MRIDATYIQLLLRNLLPGRFQFNDIDPCPIKLTAEFRVMSTAKRNQERNARGFARCSNLSQGCI